jgi:transporter family protein
MGWLGLAIVSAMAAGATSVLAKAGLADVPSHLGNAVRTAIVLALSVAVLLWTGEHQRASSLTPRTWLLLGLSGTATAVSWIAYFKALTLAAATPVTAIDRTSLAVTAVLSAAFLGESLGWTAALGVTLIVIGSILTSAGAR